MQMSAPADGRGRPVRPGRCAHLAGSVAAAFAVAAPEAAQAHAFGGRYDLPLPLWLYLVGAGASVALSFVLAAWFSRPAPPPPDDDPAVAGDRDIRRRPPLLLEVLAVAAFVLLLVAGFVGNQDDPFANVLPVVVWILWWIGLAYVSALAGDLWALINPLPILAGWAGAVWMKFAGRRLLARRPVPARIGVWPAVVAFLAFGWAELIWTSNTVPMKLALAILAYAVWMWAGMAMYGVRAWTESADCLARFFHLFSRFAPFDFTTGRWRGFGHGLMVPDAAGPAGARSRTAFIMLALGIVAFDGIRETPFWLSVRVAALTAYHRNALDALVDRFTADKLIHTAGLIAIPLLFAIIFAAVCRLMAGAGRRGAAGPSPTPDQIAWRFAPALVPIAIAYHLAHYLTYLLIWGQAIIPLASDPLGLGWNLFGTAGYTPDSTLVGPRFAWIASLLAIVGGHAAAIVIGHRIAIAVYRDRAAAAWSQAPMLILMVAYTMLGLWILAQPIVEF